MAKIIGQAGDSQQERAIKRRQNAIICFFFLTAAACFIIGFATAKMSLWWCFAAAIIVYPAFKIFSRLSDQQIRMSRADEKGASGEIAIDRYLKELPDTYTVVNDLSFADSYGNIDHLVLGPTGVFAIDVKNWRGTVSADGKDELLCNGKPTEKPLIKNFTRRAMELKNRIRALTAMDPYVQCLFVFPHTQIEAKWGTTAAVHCISAEQIKDYVMKGRAGKQLSPNDIQRIVSATEALRKMVVTDVGALDVDQKKNSTS